MIVQHLMQWLKRPSNSFKKAIQHCKMQYRTEEKLLHGCKTCSGAPEHVLRDALRLRVRPKHNYN